MVLLNSREMLRIDSAAAILAADNLPRQTLILKIISLRPAAASIPEPIQRIIPFLAVRPLHLVQVNFIIIQRQVIQ